MTRTKLATLSLAMVIAVATPCGSAEKDTTCPLPLAVQRDSSGNLVGNVTTDLLYKAFPEFKYRTSWYTPKRQVIEKLRMVNAPVEIIMLFGTWCKDSLSEVPKFLKVLDAAKNNNFSLRMYAVDRSKKDCDGQWEKLQITRVPTMVFLRDGKELGRIVEYPKTTIEEDVLAIVTGPR